MAKKNQPDELVNESIRFREVLVIGPNGESLGIMSSREAVERAYERNLDLVCVAPHATPPVCKILDFGKYRFEQQKKAKEAKRNQKVTEVKPLRISPVIDKNDFDTKQKHAVKWLQEGKKVRLDMRFRGRMMTRIDVGRKIMEDFIESVREYGNVEKAPNMEGNTMSCVISPLKK